MFDPFINSMLDGNQLDGTYNTFDHNNMISGHTQINGNNINTFDNNWHSTGHSQVNGNFATSFDNNWNATGHHIHSGNMDMEFDANHKLIATHTTLPNGNIISTNAHGGFGGITNQNGTFDNLGQKIQSFKKIF